MFPSTKYTRAVEAFHKIRSELYLIKGSSKSVEMSKETFVHLWKILSPTINDIKPYYTPVGSLGMIDKVPINENADVPYGDAMIVTNKE